MTAAGDPLGSGLVASLARPGGNITGMSLMAPDLGGKRLELLMELLPQLSRVGILWNATTPHSSSRRRGTQLKRFELNTNLSRCEILMILILPLQLRHSSV
jgi:putative ABC transport system substrate-binding protein